LTGSEISCHHPSLLGEENFLGLTRDIAICRQPTSYSSLLRPVLRNVVAGRTLNAVNLILGGFGLMVLSGSVQKSPLAVFADHPSVRRFS
jgi:hypothetical protein